MRYGLESIMSCKIHTAYNGSFVSSVRFLDCVVAKALHDALVVLSYNSITVIQ